MNFSRIVRRWRTTNITDAGSFASKIPTITKPSGDGVVDFTSGATRIVPSHAKLWPVSDTACKLRILGWHQVIQGAKVTLWFPTIIAEFDCSAIATAGVAGAAVLSSELFCNYIAPVIKKIEDSVTGAGAAVFSEVRVASFDPDDLIAHIILPLRAFELYEITTQSATNFNCLYSLIEELD